MGKNVITINGRTVSINGGVSVSVINGKIMIDGQNVDLNVEGIKEAPVYNITVTGDVDKVEGSFSEITVNGNVDTAKTASGDIKVEGDIRGNASTMSGDVKVNGTIHGNASSMSGDIKHR